MSSKEGEVIKGCVKACARKGCHFAEFLPNGKCWKCGGTDFVEQCVPELGNIIIPSIKLAKKHPDLRFLDEQ